MGLGSFLLQMVQMQAVAQGYSPDIYLQANKSTEAAQYYLHWNFVRMAKNEPNQLPETLNRYYSQSKEDNDAGPYLYFVTNEQLRQDAIHNKEDPDAPETIRQHLHLHVLRGLLKSTGIAEDVKSSDGQVQKCLPIDKDKTGLFLKFPFSELKQELDNAMADLLILDHQWFKFKNAKDNDI